jgi:transketolase
MNLSTANYKLLTNTLRCLAIDSIEQAKSGHPGLPLGAAPMAAVLWAKHLRVCGAQPHWINRDRFVLSAGHGSALLYALLHLWGFPLRKEDLQQFRRLHSQTPGHPEYNPALGVEATTGPLGQGAANAVGMAITERYLHRRFQRADFVPFDYHTYALLSDGDIMEGVVHEAASLAGHLGLGKLIYLYDANAITLDGALKQSCSENVAMRFEAYGWHVLQVEAGDTDFSGIDEALVRARQETQRPSLLIIKTTIGFAAPNKQGSAAAHGSPLGEHEWQATRTALGFATEPAFTVTEEAEALLRVVRDKQQQHWRAWQNMWELAQREQPEWTAEIEQMLYHTPRVSWEDLLAACKGDATEQSTRQRAGRGLQVLGKTYSSLCSGDADLSSSTLNRLEGETSFSRENPLGRNIHYGVREHAMAAIANGMAYTGFLTPVVATFLVFSDYYRPAMRLAALSHLPVLYMLTHDSIGVGEDGPTHQPVEQLACLRALPNLEVWRPAGAWETAAALQEGIQRRSGPTAWVLTRQKLASVPEQGLHDTSPMRGGYVIWEKPNYTLILLATGSEVALAIAVAEHVFAQHMAARVVSLPCWERFAAQPAAYREMVLPDSCEMRWAIEAGVALGWERWVGPRGGVVALDRFGVSAPGADTMQHLGFDAKSIAAHILQHKQKRIEHKILNKHEPNISAMYS